MGPVKVARFITGKLLTRRIVNVLVSIGSLVLRVCEAISIPENTNSTLCSQAVITDLGMICICIACPGCVGVWDYYESSGSNHRPLHEQCGSHDPGNLVGMSSSQHKGRGPFHFAVQIVYTGIHSRTAQRGVVIGNPSDSRNPISRPHIVNYRLSQSRRYSHCHHQSRRENCTDRPTHSAHLIPSRHMLSCYLVLSSFMIAGPMAILSSTSVRGILFFCANRVKNPSSFPARTTKMWCA